MKKTHIIFENVMGSELDLTLYHCTTIGELTKTLPNYTIDIYIVDTERTSNSTTKITLQNGQANFNKNVLTNLSYNNFMSDFIDIFGMYFKWNVEDDLTNANNYLITPIIEKKIIQYIQSLSFSETLEFNYIKYIKINEKMQNITIDLSGEKRVDDFDLDFIVNASTNGILEINGSHKCMSMMPQSALFSISKDNEALIVEGPGYYEEDLVHPTIENEDYILNLDWLDASLVNIDLFEMETHIKI